MKIGNDDFVRVAGFLVSVICFMSAIDAYMTDPFWLFDAVLYIAGGLFGLFVAINGIDYN